MSVIFVVEEAFLVCLSDFCLIFHLFVKILFSNIFKLMLNFVLSYMSQPHQSPRIFDNYSIIPSDLVFALKLLYQLQIFVTVVHMTDKRI